MSGHDVKERSVVKGGVDAPPESAAAMARGAGKRADNATQGNQPQQPEDPIAASPWWQVLLFSYVSPLVDKARRAGITVDDVWDVQSVQSKAAYARFDAKWQQLNSADGRRARGRAPTVGDVFWSLYFWEFMRSHVLYIMRVACQIALPNVVRQVRLCWP